MSNVNLATLWPGGEPDTPKQFVAPALEVAGPVPSSAECPIRTAESFIRRFCVLPEAAYLPLALWSVGTYSPASYDCFPYIALLSPAKRCGKTRLLEVLELLCARPLRITSASPASIFRLLKGMPTLLLDEVEALASPKPSESAQTILAILNAGHRKGASVTRCVPPDWHVEHFPVYGPKAFAAIGRLPDTLTDRSICIPMQRKTASQHVERFLFARTASEAQPIRKFIARWMKANEAALRQLYREIEDIRFLADRDADLWTPIFALCAVAAPERLDELKRCALTLSRGKEADDLDDSLPLMLLADIRAVWNPGAMQMKSAELIGKLERLPESRWQEPEYRLTPRKLAGMLRPFAIEPRQIRLGTETAKGYLWRDFEAAFSRYLPQTGPERETCETTRVNIDENVIFASETQPSCFGNENTPKPA